MDKIVIYGAGNRAKDLNYIGEFDRFNVIAFCDKDEKKYGNKFEDEIDIISPKKLKDIEFDYIYISSLKYQNIIKEQLMKDYNIPENKIKYFEANKSRGELIYWKKQFIRERGEFSNHHYKELMLSIAEENDDDFWKNKIVADFGCGPRGSLFWTNAPSIKIGIDVLANQYFDEFAECLSKHNMIYVNSSEDRIPISENFIDYLCTINSLDHVTNLEKMTSEILRILKPNGIILGSFNLNEPVSECEPQILTEDILCNKFLKYFKILSYRTAYKENGDTYLNFRKGNYIDKIDNGREAILWIKAVKL